MKLVDMIFVNAIFSDKKNQFEVTCSHTDAVFDTTDYEWLIKDIETVIDIENKYQLTATYTPVFRVNGSLAHWGYPKDIERSEFVNKLDRSS